MTHDFSNFDMWEEFDQTKQYELVNPEGKASKTRSWFKRDEADKANQQLNEDTKADGGGWSWRKRS